MGTKKGPRPQIWSKLEKTLTKAGLSSAEFARYAYGAIYPDENCDVESEKRERNFPKTFTRQLSRGSSSPRKMERAEQYLQILYNHPDYVKRTGHVSPRVIDYPEIDEKTRIGLRRVSRQLDEHLRFHDEDEEL